MATTPPLGIRVSEEMKENWKRAAERDASVNSLSEWVKKICEEAANKNPKKKR